MRSTARRRRRRSAERARRGRRVLGRASCRAGCAARTTTPARATPTPAARWSSRATAARRRCRRASSSTISSPTPRRMPRPDRDATLTRLHRVTAPRTPRDEVFVFAFDHRNQFFELAQRSRRRRSAHAGAQEALRRGGRADRSRARPRRPHRRAVRRPLRPGRAERRDRTRLVDRPAGRAAGIESARVRSRPLDRHDADRVAARARRRSASSSSIPTTTSTTASSRKRRCARSTTRCRRAATSCCSK